jgi:adenosylmethionine-8-amino-7-oxononanoate aminotransferase
VSSKTHQQLRDADNQFVWHPFTAMQAYAEENAPIIERAKGFQLFDTEGNQYLDGISSLWCNVHGHQVPEIDEAIRAQLSKVSHSTLLGLSSSPSIELAERLVEITPAGLNRVFYSDSGATAVEVALKLAYQYHQQKKSGAGRRDLFVGVSKAYHGDTVGTVSLGGIDLFHATYGRLLFEKLAVPSPVAYRVPGEHTASGWIDFCFSEVERTIEKHRDQIAAFVIEPLVQGAGGILVHPEGYLRHVRELTAKHGIPLVADEVAVGFGRTGTLFACEQEGVTPDLICLAKGITGGYLPLAATLATEEIFSAFLGEPDEGKTFFHGHTYTGNPLAAAAAIASLDLFESNNVMANVTANASVLSEALAPLANHPHVGQIRQKGIMVGIELVANRETKEAFPSKLRVGHQVTLAARKRGVVIRPLSDVVVLMPAPGMPAELVKQLCETTIEAITEATNAG